MNRRDFLSMTTAATAGFGLPAFGWQSEKSKQKITGVRLVRTRTTRPMPRYTPSPGSWSTQGVEAVSYTHLTLPTIYSV